MKLRIQKVLAAVGVASRRHIEEMILQGRIAVNGRIVTELPVLVDPQSDRVSVDGQPVALSVSRQASLCYVLMNKPEGVYCTNVAQGEQVRAIDLLPRNFPARVYPVGRLDAESRGLLLLTNDGELTNHLTHPRYGVPKTYRAVVQGRLTPETLQRARTGFWLADKHGHGVKTAPAHIRITHRSGDSTIIEITLREGRSCPVRRILASLGHKVRDLLRIRFGPLTLKGLAPGQFRPLTPQEIHQLHRPPAPTPKPQTRNPK